MPLPYQWRAFMSRMEKGLLQAGWRRGTSPLCNDEAVLGKNAQRFSFRSPESHLKTSPGGRNVRGGGLASASWRKRSIQRAGGDHPG